MVKGQPAWKTDMGRQRPVYVHTDIGA